MFGKTTANETTNNVSVLDVRNATSIQFSDYFSFREDSANANTNSNNTHLSSGAIAGIILGAAAVVCISY
jgi:hypothetical protein